MAIIEKTNGINPNCHTDHVTNHKHCSNSAQIEVSGIIVMQCALHYGRGRSEF